MHQPLHTCSRFSEKLPDGDLGGNWFNFSASPLNPNITELHALWDATMMQWDQDFEQPLDDKSWEALTQISSSLRQKNPYDSDEMIADLKKPESEWAAEGYLLCTNFVYQLPENGQFPSDGYIFEGK